MAEIAPENIIVVSPRGECPGMKRAVDSLQQIIDQNTEGRQIIGIDRIGHNNYLQERFERQGVDFRIPSFSSRTMKEVGEIYKSIISDIPKDAIVVSSAHGVPPIFYQLIEDQELLYVDTTCPLVQKVQRQARKILEANKDIIYVGKNGHPEALSVVGIDPQRIHSIEKPSDVVGLNLNRGNRRLVRLNQTTFSAEDIQGVDILLKDYWGEQIKFEENQCFATQNRQGAIRLLSSKADIVLVLGSADSHNTNALVSIASLQTFAQRINGVNDLLEYPEYHNARTIGISAGASAPDTLVDGVLEFFQSRGVQKITQLNCANLMKGEKSRFPLAASPKRLCSSS